MFKLSRFRQERFVQEFRPYSSLRTSSHALVWDPGSAAQRRSTPGIPARANSARRGKRIAAELLNKTFLAKSVLVRFEAYMVNTATICMYMHGQYCYNMYVTGMVCTSLAWPHPVPQEREGVW